MGLWPRSSSDLTLSDMVQALERLKEAMPGAATKNPKLGVSKTIEFLKKADSDNFEAFISQLEEKKAAAPVRKRAPATPKLDVVDEYVRLLKAADTRNTEFESILAKLKSDRKVRLLELKHITAAYTGATATAKSKAKLFDVIEQVFDQRWKLAHR